jgi:hypothetical protein
MSEDNKELKSPWGMIIFGLLFSAFSALMTWGLIDSVNKQKYANSNYLPVDATVLSSRTRVSTSGSGSSSTRSYSPEIEYEYIVEGSRYKSERFWYTGSLKGEKHVDQIVARYPKGKIVKAFYDPLKPEESVLNRQKPPENIIWLITSIFWIFGLFVFFGGIKRYMKRLQHKRRAL